MRDVHLKGTIGAGLATAATLVALTLSAAPARAQSLVSTAPDHRPTTLGLRQLEALPQSEATRHGGRPPADHRYRGPLLWTVLTAAHLLDPGGTETTLSS